MIRSAQNGVVGWVVIAGGVTLALICLPAWVFSLAMGIILVLIGILLLRC